MQERGKVAYDVHMIFIATYTIAIDCLLVTCTLSTVYTSAIGTKIFSHVTGTGSHDSSAATADSETQHGASEESNQKGGSQGGGTDQESVSAG